jgi:acyl-CoA reductase-like NAD-dependent aldehyde dehydrogenase
VKAYRLTAAHLRQLPAKERDAILRAAAAEASAHYERDSGLNHFEAFGEDDLHADSSDARPRRAQVG